MRNHKFGTFVSTFLIVSGFSLILTSVLQFTTNSVPLQLAIRFISVTLIGYWIWKKFNKARSSLVAVMVVFLGQLLFIGLSPAILPFPFNVMIFPLFMLAAPFLLILPILAIITLIYAYSKKFYQENALVNPDVPQTNLVTPTRSKFKKYLAIAMIIIGLGVISVPLYYVFHTGTSEIDVPNDPLIGKSFNPNMPLMYTVGCTSCSSGPTNDRVGQSLSCIGDTNLYETMFKEGYQDVYYIPTTAILTVTKVFKPHHYGITSIDSGPGDYRMVLLKDQNGTEMTDLAHYFDGEDDSLCSLGDPIKPHVDKLFRYIESNRSANVEIALHQWVGSNDPKELQGKFDSIPSRYNVTNIQKVANSFITGLPGVNLTVDADALAYLLTAKFDYGIYEIRGLDSEYLKTLTPEDISQIKINSLRTY